SSSRPTTSTTSATVVCAASASSSRTRSTDSLVYVGQYGDVAAHLVLRDTHGSRLELDPGVLHANPLLWHELDTGVRRSVERGTLRRGADVLARLGHEIDDTNARAVLDASGLT
ncbi:hypothetical protein ABT404_54425, partial [Streptomyces hyaluromycini]